MKHRTPGKSGFFAVFFSTLTGCQFLGDIEEIEYVAPPSGVNAGMSGASGISGEGGEAGGGGEGAGAGGDGGAAGDGGLAGDGDAGGDAGAGGGGGAAGQSGAGGQAGGQAGGGGACEAVGVGNCETCMAQQCCELFASCKGAPGCLECFNSSDPCDEELPSYNLAYELIHCAARACGVVCELFTPDCEAPEVSSSQGSCIPAESKYKCNPVKGDECDAKSSCDFLGNGTVCQLAVPTAGLCEPCDFNGRYCGDGMLCFNSTCSRICCSNDDCGPQGYCDTSLDLGQGPLSVGICGG